MTNIRHHPEQADVFGEMTELNKLHAWCVRRWRMIRNANFH
jgi:hypothetical protein